MLQVRGMGGQDQFEVTGKFQGAGVIRAVDQGDFPELHIVFRRYENLGPGADPLILARVNGPVQREMDGIIVRDFSADGMVRGRPVFSGCGVAHETEGSICILGAIRPPPGDILAAPPAEPPARIGRHDAVAFMAEELGSRPRRVRRVEPPLGRRGFHELRQYGRAVTRGDDIQGRREGDFFLKQQFRRAQGGVGMEQALNGIPEQEIRQGEKRHALMMRHVGVDVDPPPFLPVGAPAEIDRVEIPVFAEDSQAGQAVEILDRLPRRDVQRQQRGIRSHHDLLFPLALQPEGGHAESFVLVRAMDIQIPERRFREAPGHVVLAAEGDLDFDGLAGHPFQE